LTSHINHLYYKLLWLQATTELKSKFTKPDQNAYVSKHLLSRLRSQKKACNFTIYGVAYYTKWFRLSSGTRLAVLSNLHSQGKFLFHQHQTWRFSALKT